MDSVSLWTVPTDHVLPPVYDTILAADERAKVQRFHRPQDQQRYQLVRIALRLLLGKTLEWDPQKIQFKYSANGKPSLAIPDLPIHFNVSHSGNYGLIGIAQHHPIGVDLEVMQPQKNFVKLAQRFFAPSEQAQLSVTTQEEQKTVFYQLWTAKEAFLKATGLGISAGLNNVVLSPDLRSYQTLPHPYLVQQWHLFSQPLFTNYWGAIALNNQENHSHSMIIQPYQWNE